MAVRAGLWVGRAGPLPRALTSRGRQKGSHRPGHTLISSTVAWWFPHLQMKRVAKDFFFNLVVLALAYSDVFWCLHMYIHVMVYVYFCKYSLLSKYCKASHFFCKFWCVLGGGGGGWQLFALARLSHGQRLALMAVVKSQQPKYLIYPYLHLTSWHFTEKTCKGICGKTLNVFFRLEYCWVT
jgi:hypothetical protein